MVYDVIMTFEADFCVSSLSDELNALHPTTAVSMTSRLNFVASLVPELELAKKLTMQRPSF